MAKTQTKGKEIHDKSITHVDVDFNDAPAKNPIVDADEMIIIDSVTKTIYKVLVSDFKVGFVPVFSRVTANTSRTTSLTLVDITGLSQVVSETGWHEFEAVISGDLFNSTAANGVVFQLTYGGTLSYVHYHYTYNATDNSIASISNIISVSENTVTVGLTNTNSKFRIKIKGIIFIATVGASLKMQYKLVTSPGMATGASVYKDSYMKLTKLR